MLSLDGAKDTDIKFMIDGLPFVMDRYSEVFIFKTLCISVGEDGGFVVVDRFL
ncbi:hypothetical protein V7127_00025 [Bacillus sp. JJ1773]|uniref:hypothetical protein n=1 Tax=Bacillus sp. JJ1773 TaxID=3122965 RepID=UPI002FFDA04B